MTGLYKKKKGHASSFSSNISTSRKKGGVLEQLPLAVRLANAIRTKIKVAVTLDKR